MLSICCAAGYGQISPKVCIVVVVVAVNVNIVVCSFCGFTSDLSHLIPFFSSSLNVYNRKLKPFFSFSILVIHSSLSFFYLLLFV